MRYPTGQERVQLGGLSETRLRAVRKCVEEPVAPFKWLRVKIAFERRGSHTSVPRLSQPQDVVSFLYKAVPEVFDDVQENIVVVPVDAQNRPVAVAIPHRGTRASAFMEVASVFLPAVLAAPATGVLLAHNHPSGSLVPSGDDRDVWNRFQRAAEILGFRALDFLVLAQSAEGPRGYSIREGSEIGPLR